MCRSTVATGAQMRTAETRLSSLKADATHSSDERTLYVDQASKPANNFERMAKISGRMMINSMFPILTDLAIRSAVGGRNCEDCDILRFFSSDQMGTSGKVGQS